MLTTRDTLTDEPCPDCDQPMMRIDPATAGTTPLLGCLRCGQHYTAEALLRRQTAGRSELDGVSIDADVHECLREDRKRGERNGSGGSGGGSSDPVDGEQIEKWFDTGERSSTVVFQKKNITVKLPLPKGTKTSEVRQALARFSKKELENYSL